SPDAWPRSSPSGGGPPSSSWVPPFADPTDGGRVHVEAPRHLRLGLPLRHPRKGLLALVRGELPRPPEPHPSGPRPGPSLTGPFRGQPPLEPGQAPQPGWPKPPGGRGRIRPGGPARLEPRSLLGSRREDIQKGPG